MELVLRTDASPSIGTGHVMRCLALAQAWMQAGGSATFAMRECPPALCERLREEGADIASIRAERASPGDAAETAARALQIGARWVVVDGYDFDCDYQARLRAAGPHALLIDDEGRAASFQADLLLNQNAFATEALYGRRAGSAHLALGGRYALLRREFEPWRLWRREIPERARRILITTGGSDPRGAALHVLRAFASLDPRYLELTLVVGAAALQRGELEREAAARGARIVFDVRHMPELMAWADLAITAAGSTCWELAYMGLPAMALVIADNQEPIARCLSERRAAVNLGRLEDLDPERLASALSALIEDRAERATLSRMGRRLIDGRGAARVVQLLQEAA